MKPRKTARKPQPKRVTQFPAGWDRERARKLAEFYDTQTPEEGAAEDDRAWSSGGTIVQVPTELLPAVREMIAKRSRGTGTARAGKRQTRRKSA